MNISNSKFKTFTHCRHKYYYKHELEIRRKVKSVQLERGSLIHECLRAYYEQGSLKAIKPVLQGAIDSLKGFDEEKALFEDIPSEVARLMRGYHNYWKDAQSLKVVEHEGSPVIEREFEVPLDKDLNFLFTMDLLVEDSLGIWPYDHKSHKKLPDDDYRASDTQSVMYYWGARELGFNPVGFVFNYIRTKAPLVPELLKSGALSKRKIDTDRATYLKAIKDHGLNPKDYEDFLKTLSYKDFFRRVRISKPEALVKNVLNDFKVAGKEMMKLKGKPASHFYRSPSIMCEWGCEYRPLCLAELMGHDVRFILETQFEKGEARYGGRENA